jgi:hypothetical protein
MHNLANKIDCGAGGNQPLILGTSIYEVVNLERAEDWFEPVLNIHTPLPPSPLFFWYSIQ